MPFLGLDAVSCSRRCFLGLDAVSWSRRCFLGLDAISWSRSCFMVEIPFLGLYVVSWSTVDAPGVVAIFCVSAVFWRRGCILSSRLPYGMEAI